MSITPNRLIESGQCVFMSEWDTGGGPNFNGYIAIYRYRRRYYVLNVNYATAAEDMEGPFLSLEQAMNESIATPLAVGPGTVSIECVLLNTHVLINRLYTVYFEYEKKEKGEKFVKIIMINDELFLASAEGIQQATI